MRRPDHAAIETIARSVPRCHTTTVMVVACGAGRDTHATTLLNAAPARPANAAVAIGVSGAPRRTMSIIPVTGTSAPSNIAIVHGQSLCTARPAAPRSVQSRRHPDKRIASQSASGIAGMIGHPRDRPGMTDSNAAAAAATPVPSAAACSSQNRGRRIALNGLPFGDIAAIRTATYAALIANQIAVLSHGATSGRTGAASCARISMSSFVSMTMFSSTSRGVPSSHGASPPSALPRSTRSLLRLPEATFRAA
jgi:hypothetical protein